MFEIGWTEMLVIAVVMIVVVGPKDLPKMLRTFGKTTAKLRVMAGDFQKQFNEALKEAELDDVKKSVDSLRSLNPAAEIRKQLNPFEKAAADVRAGLDSALKSKPNPAEPALPATHAAEPLKSGATAIPGVSGPDTMPAAPVFPVMSDPTVKPVETTAPAKSVEPAKAAAAPKQVKASAKAAPKAVAPKPVAKAAAKATPPARAKAVAPKAASAKSEPADSAK